MLVAVVVGVCVALVVGIGTSYAVFVKASLVTFESTFVGALFIDEKRELHEVGRLANVERAIVDIHRKVFALALRGVKQANGMTGWRARHTTLGDQGVQFAVVSFDIAVVAESVRRSASHMLHRVLGGSKALVGIVARMRLDKQRVAHGKRSEGHDLFTRFHFLARLVKRLEQHRLENALERRHICGNLVDRTVCHGNPFLFVRPQYKRKQGKLASQQCTPLRKMTIVLCDPHPAPIMEGKHAVADHEMCHPPRVAVALQTKKGARAMAAISIRQLIRTSCAVAISSFLLLSLSFGLSASAEADEMPRTDAPVYSLGSGSGSDTQDPPIEAGVYTIQSALSGSYVLDVAAGSTKNGANVQIYRSNNTNAQRWQVSIDENGTYRITNVGSGKCLDLAGANARNGNNIWQYNGNGSPAQQWTIRPDGDGFVLLSGVNNRYALDVTGALAKNGTNVQTYQANGTAAQRWWFIPASPAVASERTVDNGIYEIRLASNQNYAVDLAGLSYNNGANIALYQANNTLAQRWAITWESDGYYSVKNVATGKALDVAGANQAARTNIQQYASNNSAAQRWAIVKNANGSYSLMSKASGLALGLASSTAANGNNIQTALANGGTDQQFSFKASEAVCEGIYTMFSALAPTGKAVDIPGANKAAKTQAQIYNANATMAQKFQLRRVGANTFRIQNAISGKYLADSSGKVVQEVLNKSSEAQQWKAVFQGSGVSFTNAATGQCLTVSGGKAVNGAKLVTAAPSSAAAQRFRMAPTSLLAHGYYTVSNSAGTVLDIDGGSYLNGANVQVYQSNGTAAQKFKIAVSGNYCTLTNDASGKVVDVKGGSKASGANVQQYAGNGSAAQLWSAELTEEGPILFINKGSGMALDAANSGKSGSNVRQATKTGARGQQWSLTPTTSSGTSGKKLVYLTFDDGPSQHTARLLDILDKYNAKATFFVVHGSGLYTHYMSEEARRGHAVAVHSYTHDYYTIYSGSSAFWNDFNLMRNEIHAKTGIWTNLFRFPGGSSNTISRFNPGIMTRLVAEARAKGYYYFDWNVGGIDAGGTTSSYEIMNNAINGIRAKSNAVVLMHDSKGYTVDAIEGILKWGTENGYAFVPLTESSPGAHHNVQN